MSPEPDLPQREQEMTAAEVDRLLDLFEELGIKVWLDGGWGVDALLGEQTRRHSDLDIVLETEAAVMLRAALLDRGFEDVATDDRRAWNYVMGDDDGTRIDFHVVEFADDGRGIYGPVENGQCFPASAFAGEGSIGCRPVLCMGAEYQMQSHTGYQIGEGDVHDVMALHERFGLPLPDEYSACLQRGGLVDSPSSAVAAGYDQLASRWDDWTGEVFPDLRATYLERLEARLSPGSAVLELGCGTGCPVGAHLAPVHSYLGVDASPQMVGLARQHVPDGQFQVADMTTLDLPDNSFDAVVAFYSIIHVPRDRQPDLFSRVGSWLRPGGYFVGCLSAGDLPEGWEDSWLGGGPMYWSGFDADTNRRLLEEAGLEVDSAEVLTQMEGDTEVRFLWVEARRPDDPISARKEMGL
ncbi:MAG: nucleotidyltransferase domain-containing protein [Actinomycetota bacterium]